MGIHRFRLRHLFAGLGLAATALCAQADFATGVTVHLIAPGGISGISSNAVSATQSLSLAQLATGMNAGDSGDISGTYMQTGETIFFDNTSNSILLHVASGWDENNVITTGYLDQGSDPARYEIDGIRVAGATITGFKAYDATGYGTSGPSGLTGPTDLTQVISFSGNKLVFDLGTLTFVRPTAGSGAAFAEFRIDLQTAPVPEPETAWLLLAGMGLIAWRRGARRD